MWEVCYKSGYISRSKKIENLCYTLFMPAIRASEIGSYLYCRRAWWYRKQGLESANQTELAAGTELHAKHGRQVLASSLTRTVGLILLMFALILLVAYCTARII
jgi:CRISPR/Cas system-associated exonuclease Cas4 (RecB family)